eukprot:COSAG02_NODE_2389_length_8985_cov_3.175676_4_plen_60_part_00
MKGARRVSAAHPELTPGAQDLLAHRLVQQKRATRARRDALQARRTAPHLFYVSTWRKRK